MLDQPQQLAEAAVDSDGSEQFDHWLQAQLPWIRGWAVRCVRQAGRSLEESADLLQEVCVAALEAGRGLAPSAAAATPEWLRPIVERVEAACCERASAAARRCELEGLYLVGRELEPWRQVWSCEQRSLLEGALERLPARQRRVVLNDLDGRFDTASTAEALGCSDNAVRLLRSRAHRRIRELTPRLERTLPS